MKEMLDVQLSDRSATHLVHKAYSTGKNDGGNLCRNANPSLLMFRLHSDRVIV